MLLKNNNQRLYGMEEKQSFNKWINKEIICIPNFMIQCNLKDFVGKAPIAQRLNSCPEKCIEDVCL